MKTKTEVLLDLWTEARTRFTNQLEFITPDDVQKKLGDAPNSIGFLMRHIGEVELLFAKNVFGNTEVKVLARTVIDKKDSGEWTDLGALQLYVAESFQTLKAIVVQQIDADWDTTITTKEFGTKTKAEAFGRIISHTTYHAGQIAIILKYGTH